MGFEDINAFPTPTLHTLQNEGITLNNYYTDITCTPSRASLLTGMYAVNTGLTSALLHNNPYGLSGHQTIGDTFRENGYTTSLIGKWHLGYARNEFHPLNNGFDYFYGILNGASDHYSKKIGNVRDLYENYSPIVNNTYSTSLYTEKALSTLQHETPFFTVISYQAVHTPLQVPEKFLDPCRSIINRYRRIYCGMMVAIDESLRLIVHHLKSRGMYDDTLIFITTDNGGQPWFGASNYPLRGGKNSLWEGGSRAIGVLTGGHTLSSFGTYTGLVHISDIYPTVASLLNLSLQNRELLDGIDFSEALMNNDKGGKGVREEALIHMDMWTQTFSYRYKHWKLIKGSTGDSSRYLHYGDLYCPSRNNIIDIVCCILLGADAYNFFVKEIIREFRNMYRGESIGSGLLKEPEEYSYEILIDLKEDPYEMMDYSHVYPELVQLLTTKAYESVKKSQPQFKWFVADYNVRYDETLKSGKHFYPWLTARENVKEYNFIKYFVFMFLVKQCTFFFVCVCGSIYFCLCIWRYTGGGGGYTGRNNINYVELLGLVPFLYSAFTHSSTIASIVTLNGVMYHTHPTSVYLRVWDCLWNSILILYVVWCKPHTFLHALIAFASWYINLEVNSPIVHILGVQWVLYVALLDYLNVVIGE